MPSFDDPSRNGFRPLLDFKQAALPAEPRFTTTRTGVSAQVCDVPEQKLASPVITRQLTLEPLPTTTRQLTDSLTSVSQPGVWRPPLVIKGEMKKLALVPTALPPAEQQKRHRITSLTAMGFLLLVVMLTFLTATPLGHDVGFSFQPFQFSNSLFRDSQIGPRSLVAQATATAIYHQHNDGYDPFSYGNQIIKDGLRTLNWPVGQCTYWANLRYQQLTGYWIPWNGNADQWVTGARLAHWNVDTKPHVPSVMVLMPGVQGASGYGHVAVVESINTDGSVHTSNMNWYSNGGGFDRYSTVDFTPGPGVYFVWHT